MTEMECQAVTNYYSDANEVDRQEEVSPSGRFKLVIRSYKTSEGCWNYSRGTVYRSDGTEVADVTRNYFSFVHLFIEDHPSGHAYLVCGADYQGQTVIDLETGARRDHLPKEAEDGVAFCWASYEFHAPTATLVVQGCHWACPYEYRLYDFTDPIGSGWPELETDQWIDDDALAPELRDDGTVRTFDSHRVFTRLGIREHHDALDDVPDEELDDDNNWTRVTDAIKTFRRDGNRLVLAGEWVSEEERALRERRKRQKEEWEANVAAITAVDPFYSWVTAQPLPDGIERHMSYMFPGPASSDKNTLHFRFYFQDKSQGKHRPVGYLCWGSESGPVYTSNWTYGKGEQRVDFERSQDGLSAAFGAAVGHVGK
jgi:hypothetical protein